MSQNKVPHMKMPYTQGCHRHEPKNKDSGRPVGHIQANQGSSGPPSFQRTKNKGLRLKIKHFTAD